MGIPVLNELKKETMRLTIAGSGLAAGDFRLKNLLPSLERLGKETPVFARLHSQVETLVSADRKGSARALLELGTLIHAIEYTQGALSGADELNPMPVRNFPLKTELSFRELNMISTALTQSGSGRTQLLREHSAGKSGDTRLLPDLIEGLGQYFEVADIAMERLIEYGDIIVPVLMDEFNLKGTKRDARILQLIFHFEKDKLKHMYLEAAAKGSAEVKKTAAVIICEAGFSEAEQLIEDFENSSNKDFKELAKTLRKKYKPGILKAIFRRKN